MRLVLTCAACPEQYDLVLADGTQIAYYRLRSGHFTVQVPDHLGDLVYATSWAEEDRRKGTFDNDDERYVELLAGTRAALRAAANNGTDAVDFLAERVVARAIEKLAPERRAR